MIKINNKSYSWRVDHHRVSLKHTLTRRHRGVAYSFSWLAVDVDPDPRKRTLSFLKAQIREAARQIDRRIYVEESRAAEFS